MDAQTVINALFGLVGILFGWFLTNLRDALHSVHGDVSDLSDKVQAIEILVAGTYIKRDEFEKLGAALFAKLDKIEAKLDRKVDSEICLTRTHEK